MYAFQFAETISIVLLIECVARCYRRENFSICSKNDPRPSKYDNISLFLYLFIMRWHKFMVFFLSFSLSLVCALARSLSFRLFDFDDLCRNANFASPLNVRNLMRSEICEIKRNEVHADTLSTICTRVRFVVRA